jgi:TP901-1 family phage major tail protein
MAAQKGRSILLKVGNGASPQTFTSIGGLRSKNITINNETVDITSGNTAPWRQLLADAGLRSAALSGSGVFEDDAAILEVEAMAFDGSHEEFQLVFGNGDIIQGVFQVTSFQYAGEHNGEQTYSISLESAGVCTMMRG